MTQRNETLGRKEGDLPLPHVADRGGRSREVHPEVSRAQPSPRG